MNEIPETIEITSSMTIAEMIAWFEKKYVLGLDNTGSFVWVSDVEDE